MFFTLEERNSRLELSGVQNRITLPVGNTHHVLHYSRSGSRKVHKLQFCRAKGAISLTWALRPDIVKVFKARSMRKKGANRLLWAVGVADLAVRVKTWSRTHQLYSVEQAGLFFFILLFALFSEHIWSNTLQTEYIVPGKDLLRTHFHFDTLKKTPKWTNTQWPATDGQISSSKRGADNRSPENQTDRKAKMGAVPLDCIISSAWMLTLTGAIEPLLHRIHSCILPTKAGQTNTAPVCCTTEKLVSLVFHFSPESLLFFKR